MKNLRKRQIEAAQEFVNVTLDSLNTEQGVHAETAVAALARMAGTCLFRSFSFPMSEIQPGQIVLSDRSNLQGPVLMEILREALIQLGVSLNAESLGREANSRIQSNQSFLETQGLLEPRFKPIQKRLSLSQQEAAEACALATALLIEDRLEALDPTVAYNNAIYGFIEGTKTAPDPVVLKDSH
jgi:hypothetical protein